LFNLLAIVFAVIESPEKILFFTACYLCLFTKPNRNPRAVFLISELARERNNDFTSGRFITRVVFHGKAFHEKDTVSRKIIAGYLYLRVVERALEGSARTSMSAYNHRCDCGFYRIFMEVPMSLARFDACTMNCRNQNKPVIIVIKTWSIIFEIAIFIYRIDCIKLYWIILIFYNNYNYFCDENLLQGDTVK